MESINEKDNETALALEYCLNLEDTNQCTKYNIKPEKPETEESGATNVDRIQTCTARFGGMRDIPSTNDKHSKLVGEQNFVKPNEPNSSNNITNEVHEGVQELSDIASEATKSSNPMSLMTDKSQGVELESASKDSLVDNKTRNSITNQLILGEHESACSETSTNSAPSRHSTTRKRHTDTSKHLTESGQEFVIHHEHCEKLDGSSNNADLQQDFDTQQQHVKDSLPSNVSDSELVNLPEYLTENSTKDFSLFHYLKLEITRGNLVDEKEDKYVDQREKIYTFMKTPRELEKLMWFGFLLCLDCFLFVFTYLPVRVLFAILQLLGNVVSLKFLRNKLSFLEPHTTCDLLRGFILLVCCAAMNSLDLSILYHIVRGQSVIKLYVIYNMLDIADRLFSSIGQDTLDALFWTAAEPRQKRSIVMITLHFGLASVYVFLHAVLVLFQAITLNVAINSHNKVLMVVMVSNQFVELKGSVFKKFEKTNLFQMSCSDIRERFYYVVLVSLVALRNMHELQWNLDHLYELFPSVAMLLFSEVFVDWVKHAFITKFNAIPSEVYREYRELLALDATTSRLFGQRACSDHFDLVSRRLGFIPLPLSCVVYRVTSQSVQISATAGIVVLVLVYLWLTSVKILNSIILLGLSSHYVMNKTTNNSESKPYMESSPSPSDLQLPVSDPLDRDQNRMVKASRPRQVKALNEIDRYTLCSNRIV